MAHLKGGIVMKAHAFLTIVVLLNAVVSAGVSVSVYQPDGHTPLGPVEPNLIRVYPDIMVGTRLVLVVNSDTAGYWFGGLLLTWNNWVVGNLSARGENSGWPEFSYEESVLPAAGTAALVQDCIEPSLVGVDLTAWFDGVAGDWFVIDYRAEQIGLCYVGVYDYDFSLDVPFETLLFSHVPSRDFSADTLVNFMDFALLASWWAQEAPDDLPAASSFDLDADGSVGITDVALFSEFWLERTDYNEPAADPNALLP
jgi:hypothetical protein